MLIVRFILLRPSMGGFSVALALGVMLATPAQATSGSNMTHKYSYAAHALFVLKVVNRIFLSEHLGTTGDVLNYTKYCTDDESASSLPRFLDTHSDVGGGKIWKPPCIPARLLNFKANLGARRIEISLPNSAATAKVLDGLRAVSNEGQMGSYAMTLKRARETAVELLALHKFSPLPNDKLPASLFCFPTLDSADRHSLKRTTNLFSSLKFLLLNSAELKMGTKPGEAVLSFSFGDGFLVVD